MKLVQRFNLAVMALVAMLFAGPAMAQTATPPDLTPISDAVVSGIGQGITVLLALAPIVILFAVVMGIIRKARSFAK